MLSKSPSFLLVPFQIIAPVATFVTVSYSFSEIMCKMRWLSYFQHLTLNILSSRAKAEIFEKHYAVYFLTIAISGNSYCFQIYIFILVRYFILNIQRLQFSLNHQFLRRVAHQNHLESFYNNNNNGQALRITIT